MSVQTCIPVQWPVPFTGPDQIKLLESKAWNCILSSSPPSIKFIQAAQKAGIEVHTTVKWKSLVDLDWKEPFPAIEDGVWPGVATKGAGGGEGAGPTGVPWLDANGWAILMARALAPGKPVWIQSKPPEDQETLDPSAFRLALAEAHAYGARRPLWLPQSIWDGIVAGKSRETRIWDMLSGDAAWWKQRAAWDSWTPVASLMILSRFSGAETLISTETLNLAARRGLPFHALPLDRFDSTRLNAYRAILFTDAAPPPAPVLQALQAFANQGGTVIVGGKTGAIFKGLQSTEFPNPRFTVHTAGKGRVAIAKDEMAEPYLLAQDVHLILSRRWDRVRMFNGGAFMLHHTQSPDGRHNLLHILNYATRPGRDVSVLQTRDKVKTAVLHILGENTPRPVKLAPVEGQTEILIPPFAVHAALEWEQA